MDRSKRILGQMPEYVKQKAGRDILGHFTPLLGLRTENAREMPILLGSSTLAQFGDARGLLTAKHVVEQSSFKDFAYIGLIIATGEQRFTVRREFLRVYNTSSDCTEFGPDLAFIRLPELDAMKIAARKPFWKMDANRRKFEKLLTTRDLCLWMAFGCPDSYKSTEPGDTHFEKKFVPNALAAMSRKPSFQCRGEFDYVDLPVNYRDNDLPETFGGMSGGGLWLVPLERDIDSPNHIHVRYPTLMGVVFYQSAPENGSRILRCHGARSIYDKMADLIAKT
ncbi:MAG: hypothetical protein GY867_10935 [bacterium]|nr:hypothetical protein [bacterium]